MVYMLHRLRFTLHCMFFRGLLKRHPRRGSGLDAAKNAALEAVIIYLQRIVLPAAIGKMSHEVILAYRLEDSPRHAPKLHSIQGPPWNNSRHQYVI